MDKKIFIIDDDEFLLDMYSLKFREAGFRVEVSRGGPEALDLIKKSFKPDAILLDVVMPQLDGFEFLKRLRQDAFLKGCLVVILSNLGQKEDIEKGLALGADDYIVKAHSTPSEVLKKIQTLLEKKR